MPPRVLGGINCCINIPPWQVHFHSKPKVSTYIYVLVWARRRCPFISFSREDPPLHNRGLDAIEPCAYVARYTI